MAQQQARRRQTIGERFRDAVARRGRACFAWIWAHKPVFLFLEGLLALAAVAPAVAALLILVLGLTLMPALSVFGPIAGAANLVFLAFLGWSRHIYRAQYGGRYDAALAPYVVSRVSELKKSDYVPSYASAIDRGHPTARLVRDALRTAKRSSLSRARFLPDAPLPVGVCIFGRPLQDKTGLAWEAMRQVLPGWTFVKWPHLMDTKHGIEKKCGKRVVLWLDDLHEYGNRLEAVTLDDLIDRFAEAHIQVVVVATCRWHEAEREARAHLGYLLDHLLPIRLATKPGERSEDPVVLQPTMDQPITHTTPQPRSLQDHLSDRLTSYQDLKTSNKPEEQGARAVLRAMALLRSAGILVYTQKRVRAVAIAYGLETGDQDFRQALQKLVDLNFIGLLPELVKRGQMYRIRTRVWNWVRHVKPVKNADIRPISEWYLERVVAAQDALAANEGEALRKIWEAFRTSKDTAALILLGDAYLDPRRPYLRNSATQAIQCYLAAGIALSASNQPVQWAAAQIGLGNAFLADAGHTSLNGRSAQLDSGLAAFKAVTESAEVSAPVLSAEASQGLGNARRAMAVDATQAGNTPVAITRLEEAEQAFKVSEELYRKSHSPFQWALVNYELANVYGEEARLEAQKGETTKSIKLFRAAETSFRQAREVYTRTTAPTDWAKIQGDLGVLLLDMSEQMGINDPGKTQERLVVLRESVDALRAAVTTFRFFRMDDNWAAVSAKLGSALRSEAALSDNDERDEILTQAEESLTSALQYYRPELAPLEWSDVQMLLAKTKEQHAEVEIQNRGASSTNVKAIAFVDQAMTCLEQLFASVYNANFDEVFASSKIGEEMRRRRAEAATLQGSVANLGKRLQA
jgi:hypothetical protein